MPHIAEYFAFWNITQKFINEINSNIQLVIFLKVQD